MADEDYGGKAVWFMAGIAIGATVALLYAPATGEVTRRQDRKEGARGPGCAGRFRQGDLLERGREMYERGRKLADEAADMFERGRKIVESTASNLKG
jgi:gas vesicle protein